VAHDGMGSPSPHSCARGVTAGLLGHRCWPTVCRAAERHRRLLGACMRTCSAAATGRRAIARVATY
jgi:hypothetical protein